MTPRRKRWLGGRSAIWLLAWLYIGVLGARADEPVVTTLADYEDDSVAARIADVENVLAADCSVSVAAIPARGQRSLVVEIGATERNASAACDLRFRVATPFDQADRVATYAWITHGAVDLQFRLRDADGRIFETAVLPLRTHNRWVRLVADLASKDLHEVGRRATGEQDAPQGPTWPIEVLGYRISVHTIGRQAVFLDDLEVEHRASGPGLLRGEFRLDEPTHIYNPGDLVKAAVVLENTSRQRALPLSVRIAWLRTDGSELTTGRDSINLPASSSDYRSRQPVDFSQRIYDTGLYRLVARVHGPGWISPAVFETTIAVTGSNRALPRGRATFFGLQSNLIREPLADQLLEIDIAREIGVQLLAIETPWRLIEPSRDSFQLQTLGGLIDLVSQRDIALMIVLTEPPRWLAETGPGYWQRQGLVFEALARRYGTRIYGYQPLRQSGADSKQPDASDLVAAAEIRERLAKIRPDAVVVTPPLMISPDDAEDISLPTLPSEPGLQLAFETAGDSSADLAALETFAKHTGLKWDRTNRWFHRAEPLTDSGSLYDAVSVLRHYVRAAEDGVGGVVWFDLRDDTNDPRHPEGMTGLVRRDFSPKSSLLGFANAVGMLHGLLYAGPVRGAPAEFDSAMFIGGQRQVAVLFPKPNRVLPAVLAPYRVVEGLLTVFDFDRRERPVQRSAGTPLAVTSLNPFFITLDAQRAQAEPQLQLAHAWLRLPKAVYCGEKTTFTIEIDPPVNLRRSYIQIIMPQDAPVESSVSSRGLRGQAGDTISLDVDLTRKGAKLFEPTVLTVRLRLEGDSLEVPVNLRPLSEAAQLKTGTTISDNRYTLAHLAVPNTEEQGPLSPAVQVAYEAARIQVAIALPRGAGENAFLQLGLAIEGAEQHAEVRIGRLDNRPELSPSYGTTKKQLQGWTCARVDRKDEAPAFCRVTIPARSLGRSTFKPGTRLLLAARYVEPPAVSWALPLELEWGSGLGGSRSTVGYHWIRLAEQAER